MVLHEGALLLCMKQEIIDYEPLDIWAEMETGERKGHIANG